MRPLLLVTLALLAPALAAGVLDDVGFGRLRAELGERLPAGAGLVIVQVESSVSVDHDLDPDTPAVATWMPQRSAQGLEGLQLIDRSGAPAQASSRHATAVARRLVGMTDRVNTLEVVSTSHWLAAGGLRALTPRLPRAEAARVISHSWVARADSPGRGGRDARILRRVDWQSDRDDLIHVVGIHNKDGVTNQPLLAAAHNAIVVGRADGRHGRGTPRLDTLYVSGRARPHLVVPLKTTSAATPVVASAVLLLVDTASDPVLSSDRAVRIGRGGQRYYDAGRPEVIRAILMATADRQGRRQGGAIEDYRADLADHSDNGLDRRYGAGQLDIYAAWQLLAGGEQERSRTGDRLVATRGFDYEARLDDSPPWPGYVFDADSAGQFSATLSWHLRFGAASAGRFDASAVLNELELCLYALGVDGEQLVAASAGARETTQNLYLHLDPGRYRIEVRRAGAPRPAGLPQDYALAWQLAADN